MPELPEVEVVRAGLQPALVSSHITSVDICDSRALKRHQPHLGDFSSLLQGQTILAAVRRGKFLWFPLSGGYALLCHLGMSGQMLLREPGMPADPLTRIRITLCHPLHGELWLNFVDQRLFGSMAVDSLHPTDDGLVAGFSGHGTDSTDEEPWSRLIPQQVAHIARDPLDPAFSEDRFYAIVRAKNTGIKRMLLDQRVISGIGNIYADEALWAARLHYQCPGKQLEHARIAHLLTQVRSIVNRALAEGGTSFDSQYVNVNGTSGYFSHSLAVYGQQGKPCQRCGTTIIREPFMNRSTHLCQHCQPSVEVFP